MTHHPLGIYNGNSRYVLVQDEPPMSAEARAQMNEGAMLIGAYSLEHGGDATRKLFAECGNDFGRLFDAIRERFEQEDWQDMKDTQESVRP